MSGAAPAPAEQHFAKSLYTREFVTEYGQNLKDASGGAIDFTVDETADDWVLTLSFDSVDSHAAFTSAAAVAPPPAALSPAGATPVSHSVKSPDLAGEYQSLFETCVISPTSQAQVSAALKILMTNRARYESVAGSFVGLPWYFVGIIHGLEAGFSFKTHLHNGDPLTARTVHKPAGRPDVGQPPFEWEVSARDALIWENLDREGDFTLPRILYLFEHYNGMGYRQFGLATPYLWSFCNHYAKGKYRSDGKFDPELVSNQVGAGVLLKALQQAGGVAVV